MILNEGQWHTDVDRMHTWENGDWAIVFQGNDGFDCGYLDNDQANLRSHIPVKTMPTKEDALKYGLAAFTMTGEKANLVMMNNLGV
jgi:hypothetical protein